MVVRHETEFFLACLDGYENPNIISALCPVQIFSSMSGLGQKEEVPFFLIVLA